MTATGPIAWRARSEIPVSWDRLVDATQYGDLSLQIKTDYVKYRLFGSVVDQSVEEATYDPITLAYAGKILALEIIPAAIDYWSDQAITFSSAARGVGENVGYPDRITALYKRYALLKAEVAALIPILPGGVVAPRRMGRPAVSPSGDLRTANPATFPQFGARELPFPNTLRLP